MKEGEGSEGEGQPWLAEVTTGILIFKGLLLYHSCFDLNRCIF